MVGLFFLQRMNFCRLRNVVDALFQESCETGNRLALGYQ